MSSVVMLEGRRLHTKLAEGWLADASEHVRRADAEHGSLMLKNAILRAKGYPIQPLAPIAVEQPKKLEVPKFRKRTVKNGAPNKGGRPRKRYSNGPMITRIIGLMSERYAMSVETITGHDKRNANILPRHLAMFLARKKTSASLPEIGRYFDGRDHTTIRHAVLRIEKLAASGDVETIEALHFAYQRLGA